MTRDRRNGPLLNVAHWLPKSAANGPGERFVLWLQGCGLACPGCCNPDTWSFAPRHLLAPGDVMDRVLASDGIEGVTLTGGEPFAQARLLVPLVRAIRDAGLSLVVFTGYEMETLRSAAAREILACVDILVTGRFVLAERTGALPLRGSRNQRIVFLTDRYSERDVPAEARVEIHLDAMGTMRMTGLPPEELVFGGIGGPPARCPA